MNNKSKICIEEKLPQSQREYRAMIGGKQVNGMADHVVDINGKNVAIEAKYVKDWSKPIRNPNSKIGNKPFAMQNNKKMLSQAQEYSKLLTRLFIIQIAKIWQHTTQKIFQDAGLSNVKINITP